MRPSALASKTEITQTENDKHCITLEVLKEVSIEFLETKRFINDHLEQKCLKENISIKEGFFFDKPRSKELT